MNPEEDKYKKSTPGQIQTVKLRNICSKTLEERTGMIATYFRTVVMERPLRKIPWGFLELYVLFRDLANCFMSIFIIIIKHHANLCVF